MGFELNLGFQGGGNMYDADFQVGDYLDPGLLLERFLSDCQALSDEMKGDDYSFSYMADTIAAIYYYREYNSCEEFIKENSEYIDEERSEWVKYMWRTLDTMTDEQRADVIIESLSQMPATVDS